MFYFQYYMNRIFFTAEKKHLHPLLFSSQSVCHCDSLELPSYDAGLEDSSLSGSWKHSCPQTCSGQLPRWRSVQTRLKDMAV